MAPGYPDERNVQELKDGAQCTRLLARFAATYPRGPIGATWKVVFPPGDLVMAILEPDVEDELKNQLMPV